jgi:hypothetical protein
MIVLAAFAGSWMQPTLGAAQQPPAAPDEGPEVLTRGPIHEAYAAPIVTGSASPLVVPKQPPEPIEEVPPDVKPEGQDAIWINGYWAWDDDRKDYIWVSGVWRVPPPGYTWVAGYWTEADGAWRWVPGFWAQAESPQLTYYPEPPESVEQGPSSEPPTAQHFWVPGCWLWRETRYVWRPGYWTVGYEDWVWVPASYCWSPRGWVYIDGYWDYPFRLRGLLFAPVYFPRPVWRIAHYTYSPAVVVDVGVLTIHLFARPHYCHYYFGDYYAPIYDRLGFYPWFAIHRHRHYHYDPLFTYYRWYYRERHPEWEHHLRGWHRYFREHEDMRPPHTLVQQQALRQRIEGRTDLDRTTVVNVVNQVTLAAPVRELRQRPDAKVRLAELAPQERKQIVDLSRELRNVENQRRQLEVAASKTGRAKLEKQPPAEAAKTASRGPERVALPGVPDPRRIYPARAGALGTTTDPTTAGAVTKSPTTAKPIAPPKRTPRLPSPATPGGMGLGAEIKSVKPDLGGKSAVPQKPALPSKPSGPAKSGPGPAKSGPSFPPSATDRIVESALPAPPPSSAISKRPRGVPIDRGFGPDRTAAGASTPSTSGTGRADRIGKPDRLPEPERTGKPERR